MQSITVSRTIPLENRPDDLDDFSVPQVNFDVMIDCDSFADGESQSSGYSCTSQAPHQAEGGTTIELMLTAGTSRSRRICTMSRMRAKSTSQWDFFGTSGMHYMANLSSTAVDETPEDLFHDYHLNLQERMQNSIAFHAEMMGDIMYYDQALQQPDVKQFANAIVKEVNGHVNNKHWTLVKQKDVPKRHKLYHPYGQCNASVTPPRTRLSSTAESSWWKACVWDELLQNICTCCHLVCHQAHDSFWHHFLLGPLAS
jgi:hypothetical protein